MKHLMLLAVLLSVTTTSACQRRPQRDVAVERPLATAAEEPTETSGEGGGHDGAAEVNEPSMPSTSNPVPNVARAWAFENTPAGMLPPGFVAGAGAWSVTRVDGAPSGGGVLAQTAESDRPVFNIVLISGTEAVDVDISVRLRAVSGRVDQGGGLVWRARDAENYYIARYNPLEDNFRVYEVVDGVRTQLGSADVELDHLAWHSLRVVMRGDRIECFLDGTQHFDVRDGTFGTAGLIGLWTKADASTQFDDLQVIEASHD